MVAAVLEALVARGIGWVEPVVREASCTSRGGCLASHTRCFAVVAPLGIDHVRIGKRVHDRLGARINTDPVRWIRGIDKRLVGEDTGLEALNTALSITGLAGDVALRAATRDTIGIPKAVAGLAVGEVINLTGCAACLALATLALARFKGVLDEDVCRVALKALIACVADAVKAGVSAGPLADFELVKDVRAVLIGLNG